ncbi:SAM-dependent methyltransferase, partial [Streptococcus suis]
LIDVGKKPGMPCIRQEEIERILIEKAKENKRVVRLKSGDPYIFGRGGEEAQALVEAGIPFEIVPGVTSA